MNHYHLATRGDCDGLWDWNLATNRVHFAPRWVSMVGCEDHEVGQSPDEWMDRVHPEDRGEVQREIDAQLGGGGSEFSVQHRMLHKNGTYRWMTCHAAIVRGQDGRAVRMMGFHADATTEKIADAVTGLPNRQLFLDRIARAIDQARRERESIFAVLVLGLDRPDLPEPEAAGARDLLLPAVARRLETCLRTGDGPANLGREYLVARLDGDQFGILLEGLSDVGEAQGGGQRVLTAILAPFPAAGREVFVQGCVGMALSVTGYRRAEDVLRDAGTALHRAKALGAGRCEVFDTTLLDSTRTRLEMEADLEKAVERREFVLYYQPIVSLASNRVAGLEALVRWQHPTRGLIPPLDFLPLAEETGAIVFIGAWVLREACRQLADWHRRLSLPPGLWVSVNVSGVQFRDPALFSQIGDAVRDAGLEPRCLMVELTESTVMESPAATRGLVMQLRVMGVRVGLDDFGTGHSALSYLHQFPADFLKLDRSFIRGLETRQDMAEIVRTVNDLADRLGLEVVAEGIERGEQLAISRRLKCGYVQGFLLARPADAEQTAALLQAGLEMPAEPEAREAGTAASAALPQDPPASRPWNWRPIATAFGAVFLLVAAGIVVREATLPAARDAAPGAVARSPAATTARAPTSPVAPAASQPAAGAPAPGPGSRPVEPSVSSGAPRGDSRTPAARARESRPQAKAAAAAVPPTLAPAGPAAESFAVVHLHALGSCTGTLVVTQGGVSFVPVKSNDGFALQFHAFLVTMVNDTLVVKTDKKTYRFKPPRGTTSDSRAYFQKVRDSIDNLSR